MFYKIFKLITKNRSELFEKFIKDSSWSLIGGVFERFTMLITFIIVARVLGQSEYGQFGIIRSTVNSFIVFASFGLGVTSVKFISEYKGNSKKSVNQILTLSNILGVVLAFIISLTLFLSSNFIAINYLNSPELLNSIKCASLIMFFIALKSIQVSILNGFELYKITSINFILIAIFSFLTLSIFSLLWSFQGAIIALLINSIFSFSTNFISVFKHIKKNNYSFFVSDWTKKISILWEFSLPAALSSLVVAPVLWLVNTQIIIGSESSNDFALFDVTFQWYMAVLFLPGLVGKVILPMLTTNINSKKAILSLSLKSNFYLSSVVALVLIASSGLILNFYNFDNSNSNISFILFMLCAVIVTVNNVMGQYLVSENKIWLGFRLNIFWSFTIISLSWVLINQFRLGLLGLSLSYLISYIIHSFMQYFIIFKIKYEKN